MSITAYWKATTGFNVEDYPITLGKPVNQCSNAELIAHPMCGSISPYNNVGYSVAVEETIGGNGSKIGYVAGSAGFTYPINSYHSEEWTVGPNPSDDVRKQYRRTIFVACPTNVNLPARCITDQCNSGILIVENITAPNKLVQVFGNTPSSGSYQTFNVSMSVQCRHTCQRGQSVYSSAPNQVQYTDPDTQTTKSYYIYPVWYYEYNNVAYLFREEFHESFGGVYRQGEPDEHNYNYITCNSSYRASFSTTTPYVLAMGYNPNASSEAKALIDVVGRGAYADPIPEPAQFITTPLDFPTTNLAPDGAGVVVGLTMSNSTQAGYRVCTLNMQLWAGNEWYRAPVFCRAGTYFVNNGELLKPIIKNGIVIGYGETDAESEIDDYKDLTHPVPSTPSGGGGGGGGDDDDPSDDQLSGGIYGGASGMCNLYYMTSAEIKNLQDWFRGSTFSPGIQIPPNFDPSTQLIGLMAFTIELGGSITSDTITFRTSDNQAVNTGVSCQKAYGDDLKFDMGTINIPARMQERGVPFLDYSSQIEVYIPFCDVVQLDVQQVIGTTLKCEMWISPATGDVSAMLSSGTHPVAYTSGSCAQQLPISVGSYGAIAGARLAADNRKSQAVYQAAQNIVKDVTNAGAITSAVSNHTAVNGQGLVEFSKIPQVQSGTGLAVGAGIKAAGDIINTALNLTATNLDNKYALQVAKNSAPTHVSGSFGACTSWHFPNYCYVKITRPHFKKPDNYGHTEAVPVVATKKLSELSGLTTCVNPDVSGIGTATMQELETIKSYLMSGVIL